MLTRLTVISLQYIQISDHYDVETNIMLCVNYSWEKGRRKEGKKKKERVHEPRTNLDCRVSFIPVLSNLTSILLWEFMVSLERIVHVGEHLFMYLLTISMSSLGKCLFRFSAHFLIFFFFFCYLIALVFQILKVFTKYMICKYCLPLSRLPFHGIDGFLCCLEAF